MDQAITVFIGSEGEASIVAGPEALRTARAKMAKAMTGEWTEAGIMEIWTQRGVTDRFSFESPRQDLEPEPFEL
jgi:hypothetical protein